MSKTSRTSKVLALSFGQTLTTVASIVSGMVLARILSKADYATIRQTMLAYNFVAPLLMLGLPSALYYFLPRNENRQRGVTIDNMLLLFGLSVIFCLFLTLGGADLLAKRFNNPDLAITIKWMIGYPLYVMPVSVLGAVLVSKEKITTLTVFNVLTKFILIALTIATVLYTRSYEAPLAVQIALPFLFALVAIRIIFKNLPKDNASPSGKSMKEIIKYSAPLGIASMMGTIMLQLDKIIVSSMCTPEEFANYVNGAIEIPLIAVITGSISAVILADMSKMCHDGKKEDALILFKKATLRSSAIIFPVMVFLLMAAKPFIVTLYSAKYLESILPFIIYLFVLPIRTVMYGSILMALGQTRIILYRSIFDLLVNMILSILFIYLWGYIGAAIATIATLYIWTVPFNMYYISKGFNVPVLATLPLKKMSIVMLISIGGVFTGVFYKSFDSSALFIQLIIAAGFYFPVVFFILYRNKFLIIPPKYNQLIPQFLRND